MSFRFCRRVSAGILLLAVAACASSYSLDRSFSDVAAGAGLRIALLEDSPHDYGDVGITVYEGRLMLTGAVPSHRARTDLLGRAWKMQGVDLVIDETFTGGKPSPAERVADVRIAKTLRLRLTAARNAMASRYKIAVSRGTVYIIGAARTRAEREEVLYIASTVSGVQKVVGHIVLRAFPEGDIVPDGSAGVQ